MTNNFSLISEWFGQDLQMKQSHYFKMNKYNFSFSWNELFWNCASISNSNFLQQHFKSFPIRRTMSVSVGNWSNAFLVSKSSSSNWLLDKSKFDNNFIWRILTLNLLREFELKFKFRKLKLYWNNRSGRRIMRSNPMWTISVDSWIVRHVCHPQRSETMHYSKDLNVED